MKWMMIFSFSAKMNRYSFTHAFIFFFYYLLLSPLVLSQLPPNQTITTLINLSEFVNGWNITREPNPCSWKGVNCTNSFVTHLSLSGFGLSNSSILPIVCELASLQSLDLSNNHFSSIPLDFVRNCGAIDGLMLLNFSKNALSGSLPDFHGFVGLEHLDLSYNKLSGSISLQFDELVNLKSLNLSRNSFSGSIPTNLGKSNALEHLELSVNTFNGTIPQEVADYGNLTLIDLSANKLSGSLPDRIGELIKLEILVLSANDLSGEIPRSLSNIAPLTRFAANQNNLSGEIPSGITRFVRNLDLSYNKLSGFIPSDLLSHRNLQTVDLSYNMLVGSLPVNVSSTSRLVRLRLGSNYLTGEIPSAIFPSLTSLTYLEIDNNSFTGMIPRQLDSCQNLTLLNLAQNKLNGPLPVQLGNLGKLQVMKLQHNKLSGEIPSQFSRLQMLSTMNISLNSLSGQIPSSISNLQKLTNLNLQGNNLNGSLPDSIREMGLLIELQLGENRLSGDIPMLPPKLQIALNLSSNLFEGSIPDTLRYLSNLEVLDLSNNKFSGDIPDFLVEMKSLTQLILSNNQLTGEVPKFYSWVTVNVSGNLIQPTPPNSPPVLANRRKRVAMTVILPIAAAVVAVGVIIIIALSISRRFEKVDVEQSQLGEESRLPQVIQGNLLTTNAIHKSNINFTKAMEAVTNPLNVVLKTRFSTYYKALMPSGMSYFVKKLNRADKIFQMGSHEKFEKELEVLGKLSNSNVMTPLAYVLATDSAYLFYEYAPKGSLYDVLHGSQRNALDWASRYSIAVGVAQGLAFLHGSNNGPILLLDLSSRNIMLKSLKEPQVGDIELCKVIDPSKSTGSLSTVAGSVGYIPPEYAYTMRVTSAGNVYSFGVILLELLTGKPAVSEGTELAKWVIHLSAQQEKCDHILDFSVSRTSLAVRSQMLSVLKVAIACVNVSSEARPKMKSVLRMLLNAR